MRVYFRRLLRVPLVSNSVVMNVLYIFYSISKSYFWVRGKLTLPRSLSRCKSSDTLVVVGAGDSLNRISDADWEQLNEFDVAGISYSCLLPVRQKYYFYESPSNDKLIEEHKNKLLPIIMEGEKQGKLQNILWKNPEVRNTPLKGFLNSFQKVITVNMITKNQKSLERVVSLIRIFKLDRFFMFQARGSIFAIVLFGIALGYKRVIFCGVDLNGSPYFFEKDARYNSSGLKNPIELEGGVISAGVHPTNDSLLGMPIERAISYLSEMTDIEFYVSSAESRLAHYFPLWMF